MMRRIRNPGAAGVGRNGLGRLVLAMPALASVLAHSGGAHAAIDNTASAAASYAGQPVTSLPSAASVPVVAASPVLSVTKVAVLNDDDGVPGLSAGDSVSYTVTAANAGNVSLTSVGVADPLVALALQSGDAANPGVLDVGETWVHTGSYLVSQADLDSRGGGDGTLDNTATVTAMAGTTSLAETASASVPLAATAALSVEKTASVTWDVVAGQVITYTYLVRNTGNLTISSVTLSDLHQGSGTAPVPGGEALTADLRSPGDSTDVTPGDGLWSVLAPGDEVTFTATYTVTQTDIDTLQ